MKSEKYGINRKEVNLTCPTQYRLGHSILLLLNFEVEKLCFSVTCNIIFYQFIAIHRNQRLLSIKPAKLVLPVLLLMDSTSPAGNIGNILNKNCGVWG